MKTKILLLLLGCISSYSIYSQYSAPAAMEWATHCGASNTPDDYTTDMTADASGNIITAGYITGTAIFGSTTLMTGNQYYVAKTSPTGQTLWAKEIPISIALPSISTDASGNIYITGTIYHNGFYTYNFGSTTMNINSNYSFSFIGKIDPNGNFLWAKVFNTTQSSDGRAIKADASGNIYLSTIFGSNVTIDGTPLTAGQYICKFNPSGTLIWASAIGGYAIKIDVNNTSEVYVAGSFSGNSAFAGLSSYSGSSDIFLAKLNASGVQQWVKQWGGSNTDFLGDMTLDSNGNVYLSGNFQGTANFETNTYVSGGAENIFYMKTNSAGTVIWAKHLPSNGSQDMAYGIYTDASGNVYLAIQYKSTIQINGVAYPSFGWIDAMIVKTNSSGVPQWAYQFGGQYDDAAKGVYANASGEVFAAGEFSDEWGDWDVILDPFAGGYKDLTVFKLKMCTNQNAQIVQNGNTLSVTPSIPGAEYIWQTCDGTTIQGATASTFNPSSNGSYRVWINNNGCVSRTACKTFTASTVGLEETSYSFELFPNPTENEVTLQFNEQITLNELTIVTLAGQVLESIHDCSTKELTINLSKISNGTYLLKGKINGENFVRQIVKK